jgi:cobalamin biosynthesis protein CobT
VDELEEDMDLYVSTGPVGGVGVEDDEDVLEDSEGDIDIDEKKKKKEEEEEEEEEEEDEEEEEYGVKSRENKEEEEEEEEEEEREGKEEEEEEEEEESTCKFVTLFIFTSQLQLIDFKMPFCVPLSPEKDSEVKTLDLSGNNSFQYFRLKVSRILKVDRANMHLSYRFSNSKSGDPYHVLECRDDWLRLVKEFGRRLQQTRKGSPPLTIRIKVKIDGMYETDRKPRKV